LGGDEDIASASGGGHFGFGDGSAFKLGDAEVEVHADDCAAFVGLDVRAEARRIASDGNGATDIFADAVGVDEERGGGDVSDVGDDVPGSAHGGVTSFGTSCGLI